MNMINFILSQRMKCFRMHLRCEERASRLCFAPEPIHPIAIGVVGCKVIKLA